MGSLSIFARIVSSRLLPVATTWKRDRAQKHTSHQLDCCSCFHRLLSFLQLRPLSSMLSPAEGQNMETVVTSRPPKRTGYAHNRCPRSASSLLLLAANRTRPTDRPLCWNASPSSSKGWSSQRKARMLCGVNGDERIFLTGGGWQRGH